MQRNPKTKEMAARFSVQQVRCIASQIIKATMQRQLIVLPVMFSNISGLKTKACVWVWSGCWPLPFPTKSTVDKQASPQAQECRPAPSAHLCSMGTFHRWWSKTQTRMGYQKVTWPGGPSSTPAFPQIGCQQATSLLQHWGGGCEGRRSSAPLAEHPPPPQHMNQNEWLYHMHWAVTSPLDAHFTWSFRNTPKYPYVCHVVRHILRQSNMGDRL